MLKRMLNFFSEGEDKFHITETCKKCSKDFLSYDFREDKYGFPYSVFASLFFTDIYQGDQCLYNCKSYVVCPHCYKDFLEKNDIGFVEIEKNNT